MDSSSSHEIDVTAPTPDGIADPGGYQRYLVDLVGDDDPALVQAGTAGAWRSLLADGRDLIRMRPAPGEWSAVECLGHAVDAEIVMSGRYRWALAEDEPVLPGYDQDRWVAALRHRDDDPGSLLTLFDALRAANVALWTASGDAERARAARHVERGPESFRLMFTMIAGHDRFHLAQARRALDAAGRRRVAG